MSDTPFPNIQSRDRSKPYCSPLFRLKIIAQEAYTFAISLPAFDDDGKLYHVIEYRVGDGNSQHAGMKLIIDKVTGERTWIGQTIVEVTTPPASSSYSNEYGSGSTSFSGSYTLTTHLDDNEGKTYSVTGSITKTEDQATYGELSTHTFHTVTTWVPAGVTSSGLILWTYTRTQVENYTPDSSGNYPHTTTTDSGAPSTGNGPNFNGGTGWASTEYTPLHSTGSDESTSLDALLEASETTHTYNNQHDFTLWNRVTHSEGGSLQSISRRKAVLSFRPSATGYMKIWWRDADDAPISLEGAEDFDPMELSDPDQHPLFDAYGAMTHDTNLIDAYVDYPEESEDGLDYYKIYKWSALRGYVPDPADLKKPDGFPRPGICGCTNPFADNYNPKASIDDGSCHAVRGCTDNHASNYNPNATEDDGSCEYKGCTDPAANNYNPYASEDDGSCTYDEN